MSVSYRGLKLVLCIQELGSFGNTPLSVFLKPSLLPPVRVCVCVLKYLIFSKEKIVG